MDLVFPGRAAAAFAALPRARLPASAGVDFLHLVALQKPAVRIKLPGPASLSTVASWCAEHGYAWDSDADGFCCVAASRQLAERVLEVDRRTDAHEMELGQLLGYPACCCEAVARVGESRIDAQAKAVAAWTFEGQFQLIDPSGYTQGASLVCHLPCSPACTATLELAVRAGQFLKSRLDHPDFQSWSRWATLL